jgi:hypothetical protein
VTLSPGALAAMGAAISALGLAVLAWIRLGRRPGAPSVPVVGRVSEVSLVVMGLALLGVGYHALAHGLGWSGFRAPMRLAVAVALVAVLGSLVVDALENRADTPDDGA